MIRRRHRRAGGERGVVLTELAVSLPIFALLLTFLAFALVWGWRSYQRTVADAELRQEMQIAMARMTESVLSSSYVAQDTQGIYRMRHSIEKKHRGTPLDSYWLTGGRLVYQTSAAPLTGGYAGAGVHISSFSIRPDVHCPHLYHIEMTGESVATGRSYTAVTSVYLREDQGGR